MKRSWRAPALGTLAAVCASSALALPPDQVFERAGPSVWALRMIGPDNIARDVGSAVAIAAGKAVTVCSQMPSGAKYVLQRDAASLAATLEFADSARDLCQLDAPGLQAPEATRAAPRMAQRVYAIGYERTAEVSVGEGIVARMRAPGSDNERIQTSIPASGWLIGAGLFDDEGRLLGVTTAPAHDGPATVFAAPARWIAEVPARGKIAQVAARGDPAGVLPRDGATWTYAYAMRGTDSARLTFTVRAVGVEGGAVQEAISIGGAPARKESVQANALAFRSQPLPRNQILLEFAPYLHASYAKNEERLWGKLTGYPRGPAVMPDFTVTAQDIGQEEVTVPAGSFKAYRVQISGRRSYSSQLAAHWDFQTSRFVYNAWYSPQVRRYVKIRHETWSLKGAWSGEQLIELLSHAQ